MIGLLLRLYPARWRARYGEEFAALLAERPLGPFDVADVLLGALDARLHPRRPGASGAPMGASARLRRIGGIAAIAGGAVWLVVFFLAGAADGPAGMLGLIVGTVLLIVALAGLSAFQAHHHPRLVWAAVLIPTLGALLAIAGVVGMALWGDGPVLGPLSPWSVWLTGMLTMLLGSLLFAIASWRVGALPRWGVALLSGGAVAVLPVLSALAGGLVSDELGRLLSVAAIGSFCCGWMVLGVGALRGDRPSHATPSSLPRERH